MVEVDATAKLHSLLFGEGRELVNIKFFPGTERGLTVSQLAEAAQAALSAALAEGPINNPPVSGAKSQTLEAFLASR